MGKACMAVFCLLASINAAAADNTVITVGTGFALPPYVIIENESGLEIDIVRAAFQAEGLQIKLQFLPPARTLLLAQRRQLDAVTTVNEGSGLAGHYSDSHISYQNYAITLQPRQLRLNSLADLAGYRVAAFQNARLALGKAYADMAASNPQYSEYADQATQNRLLFNRRTDIVVGDKLIFDYLTRQLAASLDTNTSIDYHPLFPPTPYKLWFADSQLRDRFNKGLASIRKNGSYQRIINSYTTNHKN